MEALDEPVDSGIGSDFDDLESINSLNYHFEVRGNRRYVNFCYKSRNFLIVDFTEWQITHISYQMIRKN
jgi:hypothetical protein